LSALGPAGAAALPAGWKACWREIGVEGDRSCEELVAKVHCHHCPVFSLRARQYLDRPVPAEEVREQTDLAAEPARVGQDEVTLFLFRAGSEWFAVPSGAVIAAMEPRPVHSLPHRTGPLLGLVNHRGRLCLCLSLERFLGLEEAEARVMDGGRRTHAFPRFVVLAHGGASLVVPASEVLGTNRVPRAVLLDAPVTMRSAAGVFTPSVFSFEGRAVGLLDVQAVFAALQEALG
jgi:chemotaxis-related protein WspD